MIRKVLGKIIKSPWNAQYTKSVQNSYSNATVTGSSIEGKNVCISGATGDIGTALVRRFLIEKCHVILIGRSEEKLKKLCDQYNVKMDYMVMDLSIPAEIEKVYSDYVKKNRIDILINNAGVWGGAREKKFRNVPVVNLINTLNTNLKSAELLSKLLLEAYKSEKNEISIINISSICSQFNSFGYSPYGISKAGLLGLTKDLNVKYGRYGATIRAILPGSVATKMGNIKVGDNIEGNNNILNRPALAEEIAALTAVYASDIGKYCVNNLTASAGEKI